MKILISSVAISTLLLLNGCGSSDTWEEETCGDCNNNSSLSTSGDTTTSETITEGSTNTNTNTISSEKLGEALFFDKTLSKTGKTNCATCHDPDHAFVDARYQGDVNQTIFVHGAFSVGDDGISLGGRNSPTASYAMFIPEFGEQDGVYKGGQFHDGRAKTLKVQAMGPPLDPAEMQMPDASSVVERIKENSEYVSQFKALYGEEVFNDPEIAYDKMAEAISDFEKTEQFAPFDSKFDQWIAGSYTFNELEQKGYDLFNSDKTNCRLCHTVSSQGVNTESKKEIFSNYEYENVGTPRNIVAMDRRAELGLQDANATFRGLGKVADNTTHDGKSRVSTLRNIAVTDPYMSNGQFQKLRTVLEFYDFMSGKGSHNINPETGQAWGENDFPATINHEKLGATEALSDADIDALIAFLRTLTDKKYESVMRPFEPVSQ